MANIHLLSHQGVLHVFLAWYQPQGVMGGRSAVLLPRVAPSPSHPRTTCVGKGDRWEVQARKHHSVQILKVALKSNKYYAVSGHHCIPQWHLMNSGQSLTFLREGKEYKLCDVVVHQQDETKQIQSRGCIWRAVLNQFCINVSTRKPWWIWWHMWAD